MCSRKRGFQNILEEMISPSFSLVPPEAFPFVVVMSPGFIPGLGQPLGAEGAQHLGSGPTPAGSACGGSRGGPGRAGPGRLCVVCRDTR